MIASWFQTTSNRIGISFPQTGQPGDGPSWVSRFQWINGHNFGYPIFRHTHDRWWNHVESWITWSPCYFNGEVMLSLHFGWWNPCVFQVVWGAGTSAHPRNAPRAAWFGWRNQHSLSRPKIWLFPTLLLQRVWGASWGGSVWDWTTLSLIQMAICWRIWMEITKIHHGPWALVKLGYRIKLLGMIPNIYIYTYMYI